MRFGPRLALLCVLLLVAVAPVAVVGQSAAAPVAHGGSTGSEEPAAAVDGTAATQEAPRAGAGDVATQGENVTVSPESMTMTVQLQPDGDARWTVTTEFLLYNRSDREAFRQLAADYRTGDARFAYDVATFERAATAASEASGRQMEIRNPRYTNSTNTTGNVTVGRLALTFRWTNFAESSGERIHVGDAFNTTDGTWLRGLTARQTLVIRPPPGYGVLDSPGDAGVRQGAIRWKGPRTFEPGYLAQITYEGDVTPGTTEDPGPFDLSTLGLVGGLVMGLGVLAIGAYLLSQRREEGEPAPARATDPSTNGGDDSAAADAVDAGAAGAGAGAAGAAGAGAADESEADEPDVALLSDEERVEYLLERNGGRMKQATIVTETDWSNAKVSQLLSAMDEAGRIDKLRIGRENLISLPDEDPGEIEK